MNFQHLNIYVTLPQQGMSQVILNILLTPEFSKIKVVTHFQFTTLANISFKLN